MATTTSFLTLFLPLLFSLLPAVNGSVFPASSSACSGLRSSCPGPQGLCCPLPAVCLSATQCYGIDVADFTGSNPIAGGDDLTNGGVVPVLDPAAFPLPNVDLPPQSPGANIDDTYTSVLEQYLSSLTRSDVIESLASVLGGIGGGGIGNDITDIPILSTSLPSLTILTEDSPSASASGSEGDGSVFVQTSTTAGAGAGAGASGSASTSTVRSTTQRSSPTTGSTSTVVSESSGSESQTQTQTEQPTQTQAESSASNSAAPTGDVGRVSVSGGGVMLMLGLGVGVVGAVMGL